MFMERTRRKEYGSPIFEGRWLVRCPGKRIGPGLGCNGDVVIQGRRRLLITQSGAGGKALFGIQHCTNQAGGDNSFSTKVTENA